MPRTVLEGDGSPLRVAADEGPGPERARFVLLDPERELARLQALADPDKPYLTTVPDAPVAFEELHEWFRFLVGTVGFDGAVTALEQYRELGWLSPAAVEELIDHLLLLSDLDEGDADGLTARDHTLSLLFVVRLAQVQ